MWLSILTTIGDFGCCDAHWACNLTETIFPVVPLSLARQRRRARLLAAVAHVGRLRAHRRPLRRLTKVNNNNNDTWPAHVAPGHNKRRLLPRDHDQARDEDRHLRGQPRPLEGRGLAEGQEQG